MDLVIVPNLYACLASVEELPGDLDAHGVDAGVVYVVRLVEHHDRVLWKVLRYQLCDLTEGERSWKC